MINTNETTEKKQPTHTVYLVTYQDGKSQGKWHDMGAGWEHEDGNGMNISIRGTYYVIRKRKVKPE